MTRYVTIAEYFWLAEQITGVDSDTLVNASRSDLADSALHAPQAGFGEVEFYPGEDYVLQLGLRELAVPRSAVAARPALTNYLGERVVVGFRPEDLEDAAAATEHPVNQRIDATVEVREALGAETLIHFSIAATRIESETPMLKTSWPRWMLVGVRQGSVRHLKPALETTFRSM